MTWWPSVPTRAVIAPTIAGSSSTTRMRRGLVPIKRAPCGASVAAASVGCGAPRDGCAPVPGQCPCSRTVTYGWVTGRRRVGILVRCLPRRDAPPPPGGLRPRAGPPTPPGGAAPGSRFPAVAAEPPGPGLARARDPLRREVRLLGSLLGQVIAEQAGPDLFALVERIRRRTIALRHSDGDLDLEPDAERAKLAAEIG